MGQPPLIVDAHAHVFKRVRGSIGAGEVRGRSYGLLDIGGRKLQFMPPLSRSVSHTSEMLIRAMDWAGVERAVLLQGPFYGECNEYVQEAVTKHERRFLAAAFLDPWSEEASRDLERIIAARVFAAVKIEFSEETGLAGIHPSARLSEPRLESLWARLAEERLVLVLDLGKIGSRSYQTDAVRAIAMTFPNLRIVIAHLAQPAPTIFGDASSAELWRAQITLGLLANVWFDTASLAAYFPEERYPYPSVARVLKETIEIIGAEKIMWGSDIPSSYQWATYRELPDVLQRQVSFLSARQRALVCGETALAVYAG